MDLAKINLLLVNDNNLILYAQEKYLSERGFRVYTALDGDIAVRTFEYAPVGYFRVILTDIWMKRMDGDKMAEKIRTLKRQDAEEVIIIADDGAYSGAEVRSFIESGIDGFLKRIMDVGALYNVLRKYQVRFMR